MKLRQYLKIAVSGFLCAVLILSDSFLLSAAQSTDEILSDTDGVISSAREDAMSMHTEETPEIPNDTGNSADLVLPAEDAETLKENTVQSLEPTEDESGLTVSESSKAAAASAGNYTVLKVTKGDINAKGIFHAVQDLLDEARDNATAAAPYKVEVPAGNYNLDHSLCIYSNTYLSMTGVTFKLPKNAKTNLLKVGDVTDTKAGYYYKNITLEGGTWDDNKNSTTAVKVAHVSNFTMLNQTVKNVKNGHLMEIAGAENVTIKGCRFENQELPKSSKQRTYEAVQLDILVKDHMSGYRFEDLPIKNITFDKCKFTNVPRGIGSHTAILNNPVDTVKITGCEFSKIKSAAIQSMNWKNCEISGNTITGAPRGVTLYSMYPEGAYLASSAGSSKTKTTYVKPARNQNIVIKNNNITVSGQDLYVDYETAAISVSGRNLTTGTKAGKADKLPKGDYYISGVDISDNTIKTSEHGIQLTDTKNSSITHNTIRYTKSNKGSGIYLSDKSTGNEINNNTIASPNVNGIHIYTGSSARSISGNRISSSKGYGINLQGTADADLISKNQIKSCTYHGIVAYENSSAKAIKNNTISNCKGNGISFASLRDKLEISSNKISKCSGDLIQFTTGTSKNTVTIKKNTLTGTSAQSGIFFDGRKVSITENTITATKDPIVLTYNAAGSVESNILKSNISNKITINMTGYDSPAAPKSFKAAKKGKTSVNLSWKKTSGASGYVIYRATSPNGTYKKCATISGGSKTKYTDKNLKSGKTYYYKVAAFRKVSNITLTGQPGTSVSGKL